jgi:hypothetical protein
LTRFNLHSHEPAADADEPEPGDVEVGVFARGLRLLVPRDAGVDYFQGES